MGKRGRRRASEAVRDHMARVSVSDSTWTDFRRAAGDEPVSQHLASLVERDVARWRSHRVRDGVADDQELLAAVAQARELRGHLEQLVSRLEWRLDRVGAATPQTRRPARWPSP